jgi:hypothetical protein
MSLLLTKECATSLYRALTEANNLNTSRFETFFRAHIGNVPSCSIRFCYINPTGIVIDAIVPYGYSLDADFEHHRTQADFAEAYGIL